MSQPQFEWQAWSCSVMKRRDRSSTDVGSLLIPPHARTCFISQLASNQCSEDENPKTDSNNTYYLYVIVWGTRAAFDVLHIRKWAGKQMSIRISSVQKKGRQGQDGWMRAGGARAKQGAMVEQRAEGMGERTWEMGEGKKGRAQWMKYFMPQTARIIEC